MDLFDYMREKNMDQEAPLASRLRPTTLEEVVGQQHIIGKDNSYTVRSKRIKSVQLFSMDRRGPERPRLQK